MASAYASAIGIVQWMADELEEQTWAVPFGTVRYNLPVTVLEQLSESKICVYPTSSETTSEAKTQMRDENEITLKFYGHVTPQTLSIQDTYYQLMESIRNYMLHRRTNWPSGVAWEGEPIQLVVDTEMLNEYNLFSATLTFPLACIRDIA